MNLPASPSLVNAEGTVAALAKPKKLLDQVREELRLSPEEARRVIALMGGAPQLVVKLIYGSGLRLLEVLRLRVIL